MEKIDLSFGHRTEDGRLQVTGGLPEGAQLVASLQPGLKEGRRARVVGGARQ